jgi:hypothetical protein
MPCIHYPGRAESCMYLPHRLNWHRLEYMLSPAHTHAEATAIRANSGIVTRNWLHCYCFLQQEKGRRCYNKLTVVKHLELGGITFRATRLTIGVSWQAVKLASSVASYVPRTSSKVEIGRSKSTYSMKQSPSFPYLLVRIVQKSAITSGHKWHPKKLTTVNYFLANAILAS